MLADLSVGDPWGVSGDAEGLSVVLTRTETGRIRLEEAFDQGWISMQPIDPEHVVQGQSITARRRSWSAYSRAWSRMGHKCPDTGIEMSRSVGERSLIKQRLRLLWGLELEDGRSRPNLLAEALLLLSVGELVRSIRRLSSLPLAVLRRLQRSLTGTRNHTDDAVR